MLALIELRSNVVTPWSRLCHER